MRDHRTISIADQIFEQLQDEILSGKYKKGEILSEAKLSEELGVSRTPIREAVRRLEQERILDETGRGIVVVGISAEDTLTMAAATPAARMGFTDLGTIEVGKRAHLTAWTEGWQVALTITE